ncbi:terminase [Actinoplanes sp. NPDC049668]|uniref:terminase n=1 Tax=unclassified Actinoplanes TaxID=2626549 RepID=UPI0033BD49EA
MASSPAPTRSISSPSVVLGSVVPRLWTPPLRDLSDPAASWGHVFIAFCIAIGFPLDPWQRWLAIHLGELFPDGSPRYRKAIILVARQNGKTLFTRLLILYWMWIERVPEIVATSTDRAAAKRSWKKVVELAERTPLLAENLEPRHTALQIGEEDFWNTHGAHYRFAAPTRRAGRGDTLPRALLDELREHRNRDTWDAIVPAMNAVADALLVCISNEGDAESVVLHEEHDAAETFIQTGEGDPRTFLASWSAPSGAPPDSVEALAQANPGLGHRVQLDAILGQARAAMAAGGETLARFRIEILCQRVDLLEAAIRLEDWNDCGIPQAQAVDMAGHRRSVALCFDVSDDRTHATLAAAVTLDGITHIEIVAAWQGYECRKQLRRDLPGHVARIKPRKVVWMPGGPAAAVADQWPGRRLGNVLLEEVRAEEVVRACMGLEEQAAAGHLRHVFDPLLDLHVRQTQQLPQGDGWRFARRGQAPIDATYAAAGAVHAARVLPRLGPAT